MLSHYAIGASTPQVPLIAEAFATSTTPQAPVCIIGAGIGGVAAAIAIAKAGHSVTILEQAKELTQIGAGIQIPSNSTRILKEWGLLPLIESKATKVAHLCSRSYKDGSILYSQNMTPTEATYGVPYLTMHRADYLAILVNEAISLDVAIILDTTVSDIDFEATTIHTTYNSYTFDAIICADGLKSMSRSLFLGQPSPPLPSGQLDYRVSIPTSLLTESQDPEVRILALEPNVNAWLGPNAHTMSYLIKGGALLNLVFIKSDDLPESIAIASAPISELNTHLRDWNPCLKKIFAMAPGGTVLKWKICTSPPLESWVHPSGRAALLGDAAHAALPCLAQGAATALEDAYILGHLFAETQQIDIPTLLHRYFTLRKPRADRLTAASANTLDFDHLVDGPAQVARDTALREMGDRAMKETREGSAEKAGDVEGLKLGDKEIAKQKGWGDCWFDASFQAWLFGFDLEPGVRRKVRNMEKSTNI